MEFLPEEKLVELAAEKAKVEARKFWNDEYIKAHMAYAEKYKICPICGAPIVQENLEQLEKPRGLFRKLTRKHFDRKVCSKDKSHYEEKQNFWEFDR